MVARMEKNDNLTSNLIKEEMNSLLIDFVEYIFANRKESPEYVAQCKQALIYRVKNLNNILSLVKNRVGDKKCQILFAWRDLLKFRLAIFNFKTTIRNVNIWQEKKNNLRNNKKFNSKSVPNKRKGTFGDTKKKIISILKNNSEPLINTELIKKLKPLSTRSIKRNLSGLVNAGLITRRREGKKVYYSFHNRE